MARNLTTGLQRGLRRSIAGGLGASDLFSIAPLDLRFAQQKTLDPRVTFTRQSRATYVDSEGVIRTATTNLVLRSEEFGDASWAKSNCTVTDNTITAPDGELTADTITDTLDGSAVGHGIFQVPSGFGSGAAVTASVFAKAGTMPRLWIIMSNAVTFSSGNKVATCNLTTGELTNISAGVTAAAVAYPNGWWRVSVTATTDAAGSINVLFRLDNGSSFNYQGDGTGTIYLWGAQLEQSTTVGEYIPTTSTINSAPRFDHDPTTGESLGLLVEEARTNEVRSSSMTGGATGTPGTYPTGLSTNNIATGLTLQIAALGTDAGVAYVDIRVSGTTTNANGFSISLQPAADAVASSGQTWTGSCYCSLVAGSYSNITAPRLRILERTAVGGYLTEGSGVAITATGTSILQARGTVTRTIANALTARAQLGFVVGIASGVAVDFTFRFAAPQLELGSFPTSYIPTTGAAATRAADVASISGSNFSSWYRQDEGTVFAEATPIGDNGSNQFVYALAQGTGIAEEIFLLKTPGTNSITNTIRSSSSFEFSNSTDSLSPFGSNFKNAIGASSTSTNSAVNGVIQGLDTSVVMPTIDNLVLGRRANTTFLGNLLIRRLTYWPTRLPDDTLQTITV
jgi:hypothetical protein